MPGTVISFGRIWCCRSMTNRTIIAQPKSVLTANSGVGPKCATITTNIAPVAISTAGYITLMRSPHVRQRPRSSAQLRTGMFSYHASARPQVVQREAGQTID